MYSSSSAAHDLIASLPMMVVKILCRALEIDPEFKIVLRNIY